MMNEKKIDATKSVYRSNDVGWGKIDRPIIEIDAQFFVQHANRWKWKHLISFISFILISFETQSFAFWFSQQIALFLFHTN